MARQGAIADAHIGDLGEGGLKSGEKLGLELAVDIIAGVLGGDIAADIGVEQDRVADTVAVLAEAADSDIDVYTGALIHNAEGHGRGSAVLIADELLGVEVIHALILGGFAAEGEALADVLENFLDAGAETAAEDGGLGGAVIDKLARLGAELGDLALLDDYHALTVRNGNDRAVGDDIVRTAAVGGTARNSLAALYDEDVIIKRLAVKIFFPLITDDTAGCSKCCTNKTHVKNPLSILSDRFYILLTF